MLNPPPNVILIRLRADSEELVMQSKASLIIAITQDSAPIVITGKGFEVRLPTPEGSTSVQVDSLEQISIRPAGAVQLAEDEFLKRVRAGDSGDEGMGAYFRRLLRRE